MRWTGGPLKCSENSLSGLRGRHGLSGCHGRLVRPCSRGPGGQAARGTRIFQRGPNRIRRRSRRGVAALDYVLVLCVVLPLVAFILGVAPRIMNLVYQMIDMLV